MSSMVFQITGNMFVQQLVQANNKENNKDQHSWTAVKGNHQYQLDSPHKGPEIQEAFPYHELGSRPAHTDGWWSTEPLQQYASNWVK